MMVLVSIACLAASITAPPAAIARTDPGIEELWKRFPLDDERDAPAAPDRPDGDADEAPPEPAPQVEPTPIPEAGSADAGSGTAAPTGLVAAGLALLVGGACIALVLARRARRPARLPAGARESASSPQVPALAAAVHAPSKAAPEPRAPASSPQEPVPAAFAQAPSHPDPQPQPQSQPATRTRKHKRPAAPPQVPAPAAAVHAPTEPEPRPGTRTRGHKPSVVSTDAGDGNGSNASVPSNGHRAANEVTPKQKPASKAKRKPAEKPRAQPARARRSPESEPVPIPTPGHEFAESTSAGRRARAARVQECEVRWWRGYTKSQFTAIVTREDGEEICVAVSPPFRWSKSEPPPQTPPAEAALSALVESLEHKGWRVAGRGDDNWFAVRLRAAMAITRA